MTHSAFLAPIHALRLGPDNHAEDVLRGAETTARAKTEAHNRLL